MNSTDPVSPVSPDSFDVSDSSAHLSATSPAVSPKRAVLLLSGGLDSATVLAIARSQGFTVHCLAVRYQQRHSVELEAAQRVAVAGHAAELRVMDLDLSVFGGSALTDQNISVPKDRDDKTMESEIPITYVPARNTVFLSLALAYAEVIGAQAIFVGVNQVDYSGYPDCRPAFIEAFEKMANLATRVGVESPDGKAIQIVAPLMNMSKSDIVTVGTKLGVDYSLTHSCYDPVAGLACGRCDSCTLRRNGFRDAGLPDPTRYAPVSLS